MKISVIMPVYNSEKYLEAAISSVLSQKGVEIEIIAVEDCSKDSSRELLKKLADADSRIKAYFNEENVGVATVRNRALRYATGDYLAFCDSDDILPSGAYKSLLSVIGDADIAVGAHDNLYDDGLSDGICKVHASEKKSLFKALFSVSCLWTKLIKRSFVTESGVLFDPAMKIGEDVVFLAELAMKNPTYAVTDALVYRHCHHDVLVSRSLTHIYNFSAFEMHLKCRRRVLEICSSIPEAKEYVYIAFTPFMTNFIPLMPSGEDRDKAFSQFRDFLLEYDFSSNGRLFSSLVGVPLDKFEKMTSEEYVERRLTVPARERVLFEFEAGAIGFRWIIKYFVKWFKFKVRK